MERRELTGVPDELCFAADIFHAASNHQVTTPATKLSVTKAAARLPKRAWQPIRTGAQGRTRLRLGDDRGHHR